MLILTSQIWKNTCPYRRGTRAKHKIPWNLNQHKHKCADIWVQRKTQKMSSSALEVIRTQWQQFQYWSIVVLTYKCTTLNYKIKEECPCPWNVLMTFMLPAARRQSCGGSEEKEMSILSHTTNNDQTIKPHSLLLRSLFWCLLPWRWKILSYLHILYPSTIWQGS